MITINGTSTLTINNSTMTIGSYSKGGSILFSGTTTSNILINNDIDLRFRTGDFTVEWFQYQTDNNSFPRPWSLGAWPDASIAVSLESGNFFYWEQNLPNPGYINLGSMGTYKNVWVHFAIARSGSIIKVFKNGTQLGSDISSSYDYNDTVKGLKIANQTDNLASAAFGGYITNFRWVKGGALYTSDFQIPTKPLTAVANTKLLLLASNNENVTKDSSEMNKTVNSSNILWDSKNPF